MITVDTSVWLDVLDNVDTPESERCTALIEAGARVGLTDVVLTEVLQGLRTEKEVQLVERHLRAFPVLRLETLDDFSRAARPAARPGGTASRSAARSTA